MGLEKLPHLYLMFKMCILVFDLCFVVFLPCTATWSHGPYGKNERSAIWCWQPIRSAVAAGSSHRSTTGARLPRPGLWPSRSPAISSRNARAHAWRHGRHALRSTGTACDTCNSEMYCIGLKFLISVCFQLF